VFAPRAELRAAIVPLVPPAQSDTAPSCGAGERAAQCERRLSWSKLLARVFAIDVLTCPKCASRMQRVEWCTRPERIRAVLQAVGPPREQAAVA
jgi:hypothetical protein